MELFERHKLPQKDPRANWSTEGGVFKVLEHSKIFGIRKSIKNEMDHIKSIFEYFWLTGHYEK